jgi:ubiquinone/menaquinone biosynthesis C-methylase UbiE
MTAFPSWYKNYEGGLMNDYERFWNPEDKAELLEKIVNPNVWHQEIPAYLEYLFKPEWLTPEATVLEVGCGIGRLMKPVAEKVKQVYGLDFSDQMLKESKEYLKDSPNAETLKVQGDWSFRVMSNSMDLVYSVIVFQHIPERLIIEKYMAEIYRVLKPGGIVRIQTLKAPPPNSGFHGFHGHTFKDMDSFKRLFNKFTIIETQEGLGHKDWLWVTAQK